MARCCDGELPETDWRDAFPYIKHKLTSGKAEKIISGVVIAIPITRIVHGAYRSSPSPGVPLCGLRVCGAFRQTTRHEDLQMYTWSPEYFMCMPRPGVTRHAGSHPGPLALSVGQID